MNIIDRIKNFFFRTLWKKLSNRFRWSFLLRLCDSRLAKAVSLVPIFGFLIIYNDRLAPYLQIRRLAEGLGVVSPRSCHFLPGTRLDLLFIGLVLVGFAVLLFHMIAPALVKDYSGGYQFASKRMNSGKHEISPAFNAVGSAIRNITQKELEPSKPGLTSVLAMPERAFKRLLLIARFVQVASLEASKESDIKELKVGTEVSEVLDRYDDATTGSKLFREHELKRELSEIFGKERYGPDFVRLQEWVGFDILALQFTLRNCSAPYLRIFIGVLFAFGSLLTLIPTLEISGCLTFDIVDGWTWSRTPAN